MAVHRNRALIIRSLVIIVGVAILLLGLHNWLARSLGVGLIIGGIIILILAPITDVRGESFLTMSVPGWLSAAVGVGAIAAGFYDLGMAAVSMYFVFLLNRTLVMSWARQAAPAKDAPSSETGSNGSDDRG